MDSYTQLSNMEQFLAINFIGWYGIKFKVIYGISFNTWIKQYFRKCEYFVDGYSMGCSGRINVFE